MTETQDVLAEAIGSVELGFWRETPIEDPDGVHGIEARFDVRAFAEAITAALTVRGYALVRTPETLDATRERGKPSGTASNALAAAPPAPDPGAGRTQPTHEGMVLVHADGGDCHGTPLVNWRCPKCGIYPDMQSTEFRAAIQAAPSAEPPETT